MCPAAQTDFIKNDDDIYVVWYVLLDEFLTLRWCIGLVVYLLSQQVVFVVPKILHGWVLWHGHHCCFRPGMRKSHEIRSDCRGQSDENQ